MEHSEQYHPLQKIEILPVSLLDEQRTTVEALKKLAASLGLEFGWHYLLDLSWTLKQLTRLPGLGSLQGKKILDAGAGTGILQWYLADQGVEVVSVDRGSRADLPLRFRTRFHAQGLRPQDLNPAAQVARRRVNSLLGLARDALGALAAPASPGRVLIYNQDLKNLADIAPASLDAVVAISALEHNPPQDLPAVVAELERVLKPGAPLLATLCAAREQDWYHQASSGWCYTAASLRRLFGLPEQAADNYDRYDVLMEELRTCAELRDNLAAFYFQSDKNGMPWGQWDPQYPPVGVCKIKRSIV